MPRQITLQLTPRQASQQALWLPIAAKIARVNESQIAFARVVRRSIDARSRAPKVELAVELFIDPEGKPTPITFDYQDVTGKTPVVIVGAGPAGLFAALRLIELGLRPLIVERGKAVAQRKRDIALLNRGQALDPDSNYAFGEGGAGTFSDGKLFTRSKKRGDYPRLLQALVAHGAPEEILFDARPHIGSDKLPKVISAIRASIERCGGEIHFSQKITGFELQGERIRAVICGHERFEGAAVILATGHSARDVYQLLDRSGIELQAKPFAMGVRVEHPQALIDSIQYHAPERDPYLPAAEYRLVAQAAGRGVYSFCMCPGGVIVPALTATEESVVNGMSSRLRNTPYANAGIVTEIRPGDFAHLAAHGALAGLKFQQELEHAARRAAGEGFGAPAQRLVDFVAGKMSKDLPACSFHPGVVASQLSDWLPPFMSRALQAGFVEFGKKMRGFLSPDALIVGVESRTSSPVRIPRDELTLAHPRVANLYPAAEGAGYAGGILSAAIDGVRIAEAIANARY